MSVISLRTNTLFWGSAEPNMFGKFYRTFGRTPPNRTIYKFTHFLKKYRNLLQILIYILYLSQILIYTLQIIMPIDLYLTCYNEVTRFFAIYTEFLEKMFGKSSVTLPNCSSEPNVRP